jgi:hypothetical protein
MLDMESLLIGEIQRQCNFVLIAFEEIKKSLENQEPWDNIKSDRFWYSIQSFLVAKTQDRILINIKIICKKII